MSALAPATPAEVDALLAVRLALRGLLETTAGPAHNERAAVRASLFSVSGTGVEEAVGAYLARWNEGAAVGSVTVRLVDVSQARAALVRDGRELYDTIDAAIDRITKGSEAKDADRRRRLDYVDQLRTREETRELMAAYETLGRLTGPAFNANERSAAWPHGRVAPIRHGLVTALKAVALWLEDQGRPLPLPFDSAELDGLLAEWRAAQESR